MPTNIRLATFNVENLFSRPRLMNLQRHDVGDNHLRNLGNLRRELGRTQYDKPEILRLYRSIRNYIKVVEVRNKNRIAVHARIERLRRYHSLTGKKWLRERRRHRSDAASTSWAVLPVARKRWSPCQ